MSCHLDFSWDAIPNDGVSASLGLSSPFEQVANEELFQAWCQERHESIELKLFLDEALQLLKRVLNEGEVSNTSRRRVTQLVRAIRLAQSAHQSPAAE